MPVVEIGQVAAFILTGTVVLDLLARVADFVQAERGGGTLEEMAEGGEVGEGFLGSGFCSALKGWGWMPLFYFFYFIFFFGLMCGGIVRRE